MNGPFARLERTLEDLPQRYAGPGGAVAVLRDGAVLTSRSWGWADADRRIPFTPRTMALICSITKQFTCSLLLDQFPDPSALDAEVRRLLPALEGEAPGILDLCHNQSGLRDYWALAMLCGAPPEGLFGPEDARRLIGRTRSLQFRPGTRYSYANQNFRILSDIVAHRTRQPFGELLRRRLFDRAGMPEAVLCPDTSRVPGGTVGYEGTTADGFRAAVNRIHWTGDAGIAACLDDMIAWERFIDAARDDPASLYGRLSAPTTFADGATASYGFGLARATLLGRAVTCHAGGLRGWRSFRFHAAAERTSVVVLFNHMADPRAAALDLFAALLDEADAAVPSAPAPDWAGRYEEPETGLAVRVEATPDRCLRLHYAPGPEVLVPATGDEAAGVATRLRRDTGGLRMERPTDNQATHLVPLAGDAPADVEGAFRSAELASTLTCTRAGGVLYGAFSGDLGEGTMQPLLPFGPDLWLLPCPRALDVAPPGDWSLRFRRDGAGRVAGVQVGCWLARKIEYVRT